MPLTNDPEAGRQIRTANERAREDERARLRDNPGEWMDEIMDRFLLAIDKQLKQIEEVKACAIPEQERHARALASLERTLERLVRMESARASYERKVTMTYEEARAEFERRLDKLIAAAPAEACDR